MNTRTLKYEILTIIIIVTLGTLAVMYGDIR